MKVQKKLFVGGGVPGVGLGVRVDVNEELKFLRKFEKILGRGEGRARVRGVRVDVNEELKFLGKITKKNGGRDGGSGGGSGWWGSGWM